MEIKYFIKTKTPFILLFFSLLFAVCSYFDIYYTIFKYLGDLIGYSLLTNLFIFYFYMNKRFCTSTKIAVIGLMFLNFFNLIYLFFDVNGGLYDIILILIIIMVLTFLKFRK